MDEFLDRVSVILKDRRAKAEAGVPASPELALEAIKIMAEFQVLFVGLVEENMAEFDNLTRDAVRFGHEPGIDFMLKKYDIKVELGGKINPETDRQRALMWIITMAVHNITYDTKCRLAEIPQDKGVSKEIQRIIEVL